MQTITFQSFINQVLCADAIIVDGTVMYSGHTEAYPPVLDLTWDEDGEEYSIYLCEQDVNSVVILDPVTARVQARDKTYADVILLKVAPFCLA